MHDFEVQVVGETPEPKLIDGPLAAAAALALGMAVAYLAVVSIIPLAAWIVAP